MLCYELRPIRCLHRHLCGGLSRPGIYDSLPRRFLAGDAARLAQALLGRVLVHDAAGGRTAGLIVETEAYDESDPASHSYGGMTERNRVMFAPAGHLYVYRSYGVHWCCNVVAEREGVGAAVLVRALEPLEGVALMAARRGLTAADCDQRLLASGPGRVCQAMGITGEHDGVFLSRGSLRLMSPASGYRRPDIVATPRIGITKNAAAKWRFLIAGSRWVSRGLRQRPVR